MYRVLVSPGNNLPTVASRDRWPPPARNTIWRRLGPVGAGCQTPVVEGAAARTDPMARLEAVLLVSQEPLGSRKLAELAGLADGTEARTLVRTLNQMYDQEECAFCAMEVAGGFHLMSRPKFAPWLRRLCDLPVEVRLSAPSMETLAVVAYRQPVLRAAIEAVRGVQCGEILRQLMDRDLVRIVGRSEELGRPFLYGTTRQFLQVFGLRHIDELPRPRQMRAAEPDHPDDAPAAESQSSVDPESPNQPIQFSETEGGSNVKSAADMTVVPEEISQHHAAVAATEEQSRASNGDGLDDEYEDEDDDYEDDDLEDDEEEDEEDEDEDDDLEETEWEGVDDDDEEEEEDEDDWEEEDWGDEEEEEDEDDEDDWEDEADDDDDEDD